MSKVPKGLTFTLFPISAFMVVFFGVPFLVLFTYSFLDVDKSTYDLVWTFNPQNYWRAVTNDIYQRVIGQSIWVGLLVGVFTVALSYPLAYYITFTMKKRKELLLFLILISLFSSYLVRIYAWKTILGQEGIINGLLLSAGLIKEPISILLYSRWAVVITLTNILVPLAILPIYSAMQNIEPQVIEAARDLGAGRLRTFWEVTLPLSAPGLRAAFIFSFLLASGDYVTPNLIGGTQGVMVGSVVQDQFGVSFNWTLGAAISFVYLTAVLVSFLVFMIVQKKALRS